MTPDAARVTVGPARTGLGLFAAKSIEPGERIIRVEGRVVDAGVLWRRQGSTFSANCFRFGPETYLDPGNGPCRYLNHSCAPNAGIEKAENRLFLFAAKRITAGSEIAIDYSTTIGDDDIWTMRCKCGSPQCRKTIRNFGSLPVDLRRRHLKRGLVPGYIIRTLAERIA